MRDDMKTLKESKIASKLKLVWDYVYRFGAKISDNYTAACAAQAAFFMLLSVIPMISLMLAIATYLPFSQQDVLDLLMRVVPDEFAVYVADIIHDLYSRSGTTVISVSAVTLLWSASRGIAALMDGLNSMYQLRQENGFVKSRAIAIVYTILLILAFAAVMSAYVTVSHYYQKSIQDVFAIESMAKNILLLIRYIMGWLLFYAFILMLFVILPGGFGLPAGKEEKMNLGKRIRSQMPGAAFSSVAWLVITRFVGIYIAYFPNFSVMYGSLAGIVIIMLWLYFCMYSLFIGAVINYLLSKGYLTRVKKMLQ